MRYLMLLSLVLVAPSACKPSVKPDAYGTFEADEVLVSSQTTGQLLGFTPVEGASLARGVVVAIVDTSQLSLERSQLLAQRQATNSRGIEVGRQIDALQIQRDIALRNYERTKRLYSEKAATAQQLDQAERDYRVLNAQIEAARAQQQSVGNEMQSGHARVKQIEDRLLRSRVTNPVPGTVLATFVHTGEIVQQGQPLYRIADLNTLTLRAYVSETQLHSIRLGERAKVSVDAGEDTRTAYDGTIRWISSKAEFTPTPVQTRDERTDLVYAVKIVVPNPGGVLKIGMPADVALPAAAQR